MQTLCSTFVNFAAVTATVSAATTTSIITTAIAATATTAITCSLDSKKVLKMCFMRLRQA